jgi:rfaE bifunctional protein nucleotidyltransferase chain/domain
MHKTSSYNKKIVLCHGVFDVIHLGHVKYLEAAKKHGDYLVVSITADRFIQKGLGRPYFTEQRRKQMLESLSIVDEVYIAEGPTALPAIERYLPSTYVKGNDYRDQSKDLTGEIENERKAVEAYGGVIAFTDEETFSSSTLINKFFAPFSDEQKITIERINKLGGYDEIHRQISLLQTLNVLVVGEPILDIYRFCEPENISSKSPSISARFLYEETYEGGATAIANHLRDFASVTFHSPKGFNVPKKTRYIAQDKSQRIFEITGIEQQPWKGKDSKPFIDLLKEENKKSDVTIIADFGHGLFEDEVLSALCELKGFIALNVQTNSSNYGFNVFKKHKRFDYLALDLREARLAYHDRQASSLDLHHRILKDVSARVAMTLGKNGAYYDEHSVPSFSGEVVDATGAGDAFFAITSLLCKTGCPSEMIPFIGNVYAGLKTKIIGNKSAVSKLSLLRALATILK